MMSYEKSSEFRFFRDMSIIWLARNSKLPIRQILLKKMVDIENLNKFFTNDLLATYKSLRNELNTEESWLFCTLEGRLYVAGKFSQNVQRMLQKANMPIHPTYPSKMSQAQVESLLDLRFSYQRLGFQVTLAGALLGLQAMRPEEVAGLAKKDIDLENRIMILEHTKSQEAQPVPIHQDLVRPLKAYIKYLKSDEPLFIRSTGGRWNRKDVHYAVSKIADQCGLTKINPRRLRSTVAHEMASGGVALNVISRVLRHSDEATASRHYLALKGTEEARTALDHFHPASNQVDEMDD